MTKGRDAYACIKEDAWTDTDSDCIQLNDVNKLLLYVKYLQKL